MPRTIGFVGSVALLVSTITGPSLVIIPLLFQQAGWLSPLLTVTALALLSGTAALFVVEAMSSIGGNDGFEASIEFTTIAHLLLGKRWHIIIQGLMYLAMQSVVIASLLESFQSMDALVISIAKKTCAISFTDGWVCVNEIAPKAPSAFSGYILASLGTLITLTLILPLSLVRLVDNIIFQVLAFMLLIIVTIVWIVIFAVKGLDASAVPAVGPHQSSVVGFILSNFSFVVAIPAWVNNTHPSVNIRLAVWISILISCLIYVPVGWLAGSAYTFPDGSTLLQVLVTSTGHGSLDTVAKVSTYVFPLSVLISSIPVFTIVIRQNLLRGNICSNRMAIFWSAIVPWLIVIPLQTVSSLTTIINWASLIFTSPCNLLVPFILFIVSKRRSATVLSGAIAAGDPEMGWAPPEWTATSMEKGLSVTRVSHDNTEKVGTQMIANYRGVAKLALDTSPMLLTRNMSSLSKDSDPEPDTDVAIGSFIASEKTFVSMGPDTYGEQTVTPISIGRTIIRGDTDATVVNPEISEVSRKMVKSTLNAIPMSLIDRPSTPSRPVSPKQESRSENVTAGADHSGLYPAFPILSRTSRIRSTHVSAVGLVLSTAIVLVAIVGSILQTIGVAGA